VGGTKRLARIAYDNGVRAARPKEEVVEALNASLKELKPKERKLIEQIYVGGMSQTDIDRKQSIGRNNTHQKHAKILKKLRRLMKKHM